MSHQVYEFTPTHEQRVAALKSLGHFIPVGVPDDEIGMLDEGSSGYVDALRSFQEYHGLEIDGKSGPYTDRLLLNMDGTRFCACPDISENREDMRQWPRTCMDLIVAYNMPRSLPGVSSAELDQAWRDAIDDINGKCGIRMTLDNTQFSRANIWARAGNLSGGTLAWSYLSNNRCGERLEQRYDNTGRQWVRTFLQGVIGHEIGHALGMQHSQSQADLMYPYARNHITTMQVGDERRLVARYGKPAAPPAPPSPDWQTLVGTLVFGNQRLRINGEGKIE